MVADTLVEFDETDRLILHALQYDFPVAERPYGHIAAQVGLTEADVLSRVERLFAKGVIRRLGASINSRQVGYVSTLVALKVSDERIPGVAKVVNAFPGVTHNYLRDGDYNMWFTAIASDQDNLNHILQTVEDTHGVEAIMPLPAQQVFKVSVKFPLAAG
jgi:DNA-binding Lrp family transcriptional regulator